MSWRSFTFSRHKELFNLIQKHKARAIREQFLVSQAFRRNPRPYAHQTEYETWLLRDELEMDCTGHTFLSEQYYQLVRTYWLIGRGQT